ncbi:MAG: ribonuclease H-like domain-containing protein [Planctomycetes bacterium]|nr:ribonuclease H-like domain-containing protein [Planctomycetota bacterium]
MLTRTFLHLPGVGPKRERRYWGDGVLSWDDLLADRDLFDTGPAAPLEAAVTESRAKLAAREARWFEGRLGGTHFWRAARDFDDGAIAYLDIETDGSAGDRLDDRSNTVGGATVVGVWDGETARVFLRDRDLEELPAYLARYQVLCTYNGKSFDLPYLERRFGAGFFAGAHLDLRTPSHAAGWTGGLKKIEGQAGIVRPEPIRRMTGYDAVKLWGAYRSGRREALEPLVRYNLADTVNLQALLRAAYNALVSHEELPFRRFDVLQEEGTDEALERAVKAALA